jgi:uncharacterized protein
MAGNVLLDTSGWIALLNSRETHHLEALDAWDQLLTNNRSIVLTDWVIAETGNGLARNKNASPFIGSLQRLMASPRVNLVFVGSELLQEAISLYAAHSDKSWGLVDCASFALMRQHNITEAFTSDHHFEQAGFHCLLQSR